MVTTKVYSATHTAFGERLIKIERGATNSLSGSIVVGPVNKGIDEARERLKSDIRNSVLSVPRNA